MSLAHGPETCNNVSLTEHNHDIPAPIIAILIFGFALSPTSKSLNFNTIKLLPLLGVVKSDTCSIKKEEQLGILIAFKANDICSPMF